MQHLKQVRIYQAHFHELSAYIFNGRVRDHLCHVFECRISWSSPGPGGPGPGGPDPLLVLSLFDNDFLNKIFHKEALIFLFKLNIKQLIGLSFVNLNQLPPLVV